jgi:hypothetical protein
MIYNTAVMVKGKSQRFSRPRPGAEPDRPKDVFESLSRKVVLGISRDA